MGLGFFCALIVPFLSAIRLKAGTTMLETLISSRIRRSLFEHILTHPAERFYLRGLAKELGLSISPLRRELKRLEQAGMLKAVQEGNMLFYTINTASPGFFQLQQVSRQAKAPSAAPVPALDAVREASVARGARRPVSAPFLVGTAAGLTVLLIVAGLLYLGAANSRVISETARTLATRKAEVTVVVPQPSASGTMRGDRWQIVPGGFGGFSSSDANQGSY